MLPLHQLYTLIQCTVLSLNTMKYEGVTTQLCRCWTQPKYVGVRASYTWWWRTARRVAADTITMANPLASVGKQVRCAVAPKNLCAAGDTNKLHYVALVQWRQKGNVSERRTRPHTMVVVPCLTRAWCQPRHASFRDKGSTWHDSLILIG